MISERFKEELCELINRYNIERVADMPDFILADMVCRMIEAVGSPVKETLDWHGCDSVCHPKPSEAIIEKIAKEIGLEEREVEGED